MKFEKFDKETEEKIVKLWAEKEIVESLRKRNKGKEKFYFLQGPPYTSGKLHLGHAWNHALKDIVLRYKRMRGFDVWDRAGYDMHGLPTAHKVMEKNSLKYKDDIEKFGVDKFIKECLEFSKKNAEIMNDDLKRLGVTLDFSDPYYPIEDIFIDGEWFLVKKAHENNRLYLGERTLQWCASCETALAKHECEYKEIEDTSIFVKFPIKDAEKEYLVIWTTTPWTIVYNMAIMVNPELDYVKVKVKDEHWIVAKELAGPLIQGVAEEELDIGGEFKGDELKGVKYEHPWKEEVKKLEKYEKTNPSTHTVILSKEYVDTSSGSGLVHCAPGCGPEDYEVGHEHDIPPFNNLKENGQFPEGMGKFSGLIARKDDEKFIEALKEEGVLIATTKVKHEYPFCERCHEPVIFRTTPQWFFKTEDLREEMLEENKKINWVPEEAKNNYNSWLENLRDNSITKQRYWGTPVPIWKCECGKYTVIGSVKELKEKAGSVPKNLHKPWLDEVVIKCECGKDQKRIPDVLDVWVDAGTVSWNCLDYPTDKKGFEELFPADFICEGKDQIRGWFNLLMVASMLTFKRPSFKNVYMHGFVTDVEGEKMSKSLGNVISPNELIDKHGADVLRYYTCEFNAGEDMNFSWDEVQLKERYLKVLWNVHKYLRQLTRENKVNPFEFDHQLMKDLFDKEEKYIFSRLQSTIKKVTELLDSYRLDEVIKPIEELFLELSREYIQMTREKGTLGSKEDKELVTYTISHVLLEILKIFSVVCPFATEAIFQNLKEEYNLKEESVSHWGWPKVDESYIDKELELLMGGAQEVIQAILYGREKIHRGQRWPIKEVLIETEKEMTIKAIEELQEIIKRQTNVKDITIVNEVPEVKTKLQPNFDKLGPEYGELTPKIIARFASESAEAVLKHIEKEGNYSFKVEGKDVSLNKNHLKIEKEVPEHLQEVEIKKGFVYIDKEMTEELEREGIARELMRRIQQARKKAGLEKEDKIMLHVQVSEELKERLVDFEEQVKEKVGAEKLVISNLKAAKKHNFHEKFTLKNESFVLDFDKAE